MHRHAVQIAALVALTYSTTAYAAVLVDAPVSGSGSSQGYLDDLAGGQNFLVNVVFTGPVSITGFSIYGWTFDNQQPVELKVFNDNPQIRAISLLGKFDTTLGSVTQITPDYLKLTASFSGIDLDAGSYWLGMSGRSNYISWFARSGDFPLSNELQLVGDTPKYRPGPYILPFQVEGVGGPGVLAPGMEVSEFLPPLAPIPEPATWGLLVLGFAGIGVTLRRRPGEAVSR